MSRRICLPPLFLLFATVFAVPLHAQNGLDLERLEDVSDSLAHLMISEGVAPGIAVAVARDGEIVFERGYGLADVENGVAVRPETLFRIGSITKQFTSSIVMRLVERGLIDLDAPITEYLPDYPIQGHDVRVRHLLNHTSGIKSYTGLGDDFWGKATLDLTDQELVDLFDDLPFDFEPGAQYRYNNSAYYLLGVIIGEVTGVPYPRYVEDELVGPLGLRDTYYCDNDRILPFRAEGYAYPEGELHNAEYISMGAPGAAGALCSTVRDLVEWTRLLHGGEVVSSASFETMTTPTVLSGGETRPYGFGLALGGLEGHRTVAHGGGINGFVTYLAHYPDDGLTTVVLTNAGGGDPGRLEEALARTAFGLPLIVVKNLPLTAGQIEMYAGEYRLVMGENTLELRVFGEEGMLKAQATGQNVTELRFQGEHTFIPDFDDEVRLVFHVDDEGRADSLTLFQGGGEVVGTRVR